MREIKFRAWDKETNNMYIALDSLHFDDNVCAATFLSSLGDTKTVRIDNVILMQYVGLKDMNGKEIYEDDIIIDTFDIKYIVKIREYCNGIKNVYGVCFYNIDEQRIVTIDNDDELFIIGNKYENPELMEVINE
jgi:uncharacterized phage protein (TIGR01671 family)